MAKKKKKSKKTKAKRSKAKRKSPAKRKPAKKKKVAKKKVAKKKTTAKKKPKRIAKPKMAKPAGPPAVDGTLLGRVDDFFAHITVIAFTVGAPLKLGDTIRIKGHTTDLTETVTSMQIDHQAVASANKGDSVGVRISDRARKGDWIFRIP
jgi:membrane protein involved in colicin uptake